MTNEMKHRRVVRCTVDQSQYCLDTNYILSIRQAKSMRQNQQGTSEVVDHKGTEIPAFRLDDLLEYENAPRTEREHLLIVGTDLGACALVVGGLSKAITLTVDRFSPLPAIAVDPARPYFCGVADFGSVTGTSHEGDQDQWGTMRAMIALELSPAGMLSRQPGQLDHSYRAPGLRIRFNRNTSRDGQLMIFGMPHVDTLGDGMCLALSVTQVLEVIQDTSYSPVPGARDAVLGITKWREHLVTVVDILPLMGFDSLPENYRQRLVVARRADGELIGFHAAANIHTVRFPIESAPCGNLPDATRRDLLCGCFSTKEEGILLIPAIDKLLQIEGVCVA